MSHHLEGWTAIEYAERHGGTLQKYADPTERALKRVSIEKAKRVAREDARLIHMMVKSANKRKNPTKAQKRLNASKRSKQKRAAVALKKYLQQQNPGTKLAGAKVEKLKGGILKITPIKANAGKRKWAKSEQRFEVEYKGQHMGFIRATTKKAALVKARKEWGPGSYSIF